MPNYQNGKIYAIKSYQTELIYIGSTTTPLSRRLGDHRTKYKKNSKVSSKEILKYDDYYIELIENFPCNSKEELEKQEGIHIRKNINICVNCCIAGRTIKEYYIDNKQQYKERDKRYYENNKEIKKQKTKEYYENNKQKAKQYYENNKQKAKEYYENNKQKAKQYYLENAERIKKQRKQYYQKRKELKQLKEPTNNPEEN
jgi:hypothetical protein